MALVRPLQGRNGLVGFGVRRFHLRLPSVSRFAGPLPSLAYQLRKDEHRKSSKTPNPNFNVAHRSLPLSFPQDKLLYINAK